MHGILVPLSLPLISIQKTETKKTVDFLASNPQTILLDQLGRSNLIMSRSTIILTIFALCTCKYSNAITHNRKASVRLWASSWNGDLAAVKSALKNGANINWLNEDDDEIGHSALMASAIKGRLEVARHLLTIDECDVLIEDSKGMNAKAHAKAKKNDDVLAAIQQWYFKNNKADEDNDKAEDKIDQPIQDKDKDKDKKAEGDSGWFSSWFGNDEASSEM